MPLPLTPGLVLLVPTRDQERFAAALGVAAAAAATGAPVRLYLHEGATALLHALHEPDPARAAAGLPSLPEMLEETLGLGVRVIACATGLTIAGSPPVDFRIETGGLVGLMTSLGDDRLVVV